VEGLRVYRGLLANRPLSRLLLGEFVSGIGDWLYIVAIFVVIYRQSGDAVLVGAFGAIRMLPYVFLSVPAGFVADRFERRLVLLCGDVYRGSIMVILAILVTVSAPTVLIAAFAVLAACGSTFFYPAMGAYLPSLVEDERQLGPANSAWASLGNISFIIGPAIGGLLLVTGNLALPFILNAVSFVFIATILWRLPRSKPTKEEALKAAAESAATEAAAAESAGDGATDAAAASPAPEPAATPGQRLKLRPLAGLTVVQLMAGFLGGGYQAMTIVLAVQVLKAGDEANGYLNAAIGIGGLIGGLGAGALVLRRSLGVPLVVGAAIMGLGTLALGATTNLTFALVAIGVGSAGALIIDVLATTLFQRLVPNEMLGRGVGVIMAVSTLTASAGAFVLPVLIQSSGAFIPLAGAGIATIIFTAIGSFMIGPDGTRAPTPYEAIIARVAKLDLFTGVPNSRLDAAMRKLKEVPIAAGESAVRQGETADRFYIIESGTFTVTQVQAPGGEPVLLRQLGPDAVFGEIGLLKSSPRTATVTADTDGVLLALDGQDFLTLVGASGALQGRLLGLYVGSGAGSR
jgi:MFS family permease